MPLVSKSFHTVGRGSATTCELRHALSNLSTLVPSQNYVTRSTDTLSFIGGKPSPDSEVLIDDAPFGAFVTVDTLMTYSLRDICIVRRGELLIFFWKPMVSTDL
jgi:hypothetical protein